MGVAGSIGINVGQNMQATALDELPEELKSKPHKSKLWMWGMVIFVGFSLINFAALALAPASILTPLESIQFVTNIFYNKFVNKANISWAMQGGTWLTVLGTVFTVIFGPVGVPCHSVRTLENYWSRPTWLVYLIISLAIAIGSYVTHIVYTRKMKLVRVQTGEPEPWAHEMVLPVSFTLYSSLAGGAQMIVQSKVFSELLAMIFQGNLSIFMGWLLYVEIVLVVACGIIWIVKLTECLGLYNPLLILPLMVGTYILFGGVAGGIFFEEFLLMGTCQFGPNPACSVGVAASWVLYFLGMVFVLVGLYIIAKASMDLDKKEERPNFKNVLDAGGKAADLTSGTTAMNGASPSLHDNSDQSEHQRAVGAVGAVGVTDDSMGSLPNGAQQGSLQRRASRKLQRRDTWEGTFQGSLSGVNVAAHAADSAIKAAIGESVLSQPPSPKLASSPATSVPTSMPKLPASAMREGNGGSSKLHLADEPDDADDDAELRTEYVGPHNATPTSPARRALQLQISSSEEREIVEAEVTIHEVTRTTTRMTIDAEVTEGPEDGNGDGNGEEVGVIEVPMRRVSTANAAAIAMNVDKTMKRIRREQRRVQGGPADRI